MRYLPRLLPMLSLAALTSPAWGGGILPYEISTPEVGTATSGLPERVQALLKQCPPPNERVHVHVVPLATLLALKLAIASGDG